MMPQRMSCYAHPALGGVVRVLIRMRFILIRILFLFFARVRAKNMPVTVCGGVPQGLETARDQRHRSSRRLERSVSVSVFPGVRP